MSARKPRFRYSRAELADEGSAIVETAAAFVFVAVLVLGVAATQPDNAFHDYTRKAVCLVGAESCKGKSWIELEDTDPPIKRPVTFGSVPGGSVKNEANRKLGKELAAERGWTGAEWNCLDQLWQRESGWDHTAVNPTSQAAGIPQLLPSAGHEIPAGYHDDPSIQIQWGMNYIAERPNYGTPCKAWAFWQNPTGSPAGASTHWY